jgi:hypothetical protein
MWKLVSVSLEIVFMTVQDRFTVCAEHIIGSEKSFWTHTMELLGDWGHVESRFYLFVDSSYLYATLVLGLRRTYHMLRNHFGRT